MTRCFVDAIGKDFRLLAGSPAVDAGITSSVYATYAALYGIHLNVDCAGTARPQAVTWDIGAIEQAGH